MWSTVTPKPGLWAGQPGGGGGVSGQRVRAERHADVFVGAGGAASRPTPGEVRTEGAGCSIGDCAN